MTGACAGLRVVELSRGFAGSLAGMILADFGADVIRVEPPDQGSEWDDPASLLLHRGKRSVGLDLTTDGGRADFERLAATADVVLEALAPGEDHQLGIAGDALTSQHPSLVHCSITGFGSSGPLAHLPADDALVMAKAGVFRDQPGRHRAGGRPVFRGGREPSYVAGLLAIEGVLAALRAREVTGRGQRIETSLLQALTWRLNPFVRWILPEGQDPPLGGGYGYEVPSGPPGRGAEMTGQLLETADGRWIVHALFERNFFPSWIGVLGLDWIWDDERFKGAPHEFPDAATREALVELVEQRMKEKTAAEWMARYVADGNVCADVVLTTQEALHHPQVVEGGYQADVEDPRVGRIVQLGPIAKVPGAPGQVRGPAPVPRAHTAEVVAGELIPLAARTPTGARPAAGPLAGVTIVEGAIFYATCAGTAQLADLGARVIKVEPITGDPYRRAARGVGADNLVRSIQGKENIGLDLKDPRGQEILHRLVAGADVFVHNFRLGVPERLGVDEATLRTVNPKLVYQYAAAYGSTGPYRRQPAIDHVIAAFAGTTAHQSGEGNLPMKEQGADPVASLGAAVALLLGLEARDRTGEGQYVESAMIMSNLYLHAEDGLSYEGKPPRPPLDALQLGMGPTHRLYQAAPAEAGTSVEPWEDPAAHWVFLTAVDDDAFRRFATAAGRPDLGTDARFATRSARDEHGATLERELTALFSSRPARAWEADLVAAGVGCVVADAESFYAFLHRDPQARALGLTAPTSHPRFGGTYWRPAPAITFAATPGRVGPYCELGEHTQPLLRELGYDDDQIAELERESVVTWPGGAA
jgi:crotonobetainyl-CoA:carnitine CoA-transferase CaiB-like acyl-CoA transferase